MFIEVDIRKEQVYRWYQLVRVNHEMLGVKFHVNVNSQIAKPFRSFESFYRCPSRRQVNIGSTCVGATENPNVSVLPSLLTQLHDEVEQIIKQLNRQIDVIRIRDITDKNHTWKEQLFLVKASAPAEKRVQKSAIIQIFP